VGGGPVASGAAGEGDGGGGGGGGGDAGDDRGSMLGSPAPAVDGGSMLGALGGCGGELGLELCADDVVMSGHENPNIRYKCLHEQHNLFNTNS